MPSTSQAEWLNENSLRAYPFRENSTRIPSNSSGGLMGPEYALPNYVFVDAILSVPYSDRLAEAYVSSVTLAAGIFTAVVSIYDGRSSTVAGSVSTTVDAEQNKVLEFVGSGEYDRIRGAIVLGNLERFSSEYPDGVFSFKRDQTTLEARCVRPSVRCVSGIMAKNSSTGYGTTTLYGDVALIAGSNVKLTYIAASNAIKIDVNSNEGYNEKCDCGDGSGSTVSTINGISVNDIKIEGGDCISVETKDGRLVISDTCSKPCAGCEELNFVNTKVNEVVTSSSRLSAFAQELASKLETFKTNFLESERSPIYNA